MSKQRSKPIDQVEEEEEEEEECLHVQFLLLTHSLGCKSHTLSAAFPDPHLGLSDEGDTSYVHGEVQFLLLKKM